MGGGGGVRDDSSHKEAFGIPQDSQTWWTSGTCLRVLVLLRYVTLPCGLTFSRNIFFLFLLGKAVAKMRSDACVRIII